jgi:hypothetical protein
VLPSYILGKYAEGRSEAAGDIGSGGSEDGGPLVPQARCAISDQCNDGG